MAGNENIIENGRFIKKTVDVVMMACYNTSHLSKQAMKIAGWLWASRVGASNRTDRQAVIVGKNLATNWRRMHPTRPVDAKQMLGKSLAIVRLPMSDDCDNHQG